MILDQYGRPLEEAMPAMPAAGQFVIAEPDYDRRARDVSYDLTPADVDRILRIANTGDCREQSELALELGEKNWEILHNLETRRNALLGCGFDIRPGDDSDAAKYAADGFRKALEAVDFYELREHLMKVLLPGFAVAEIIWKPGGRLGGFGLLEQPAFTFRNSLEPLLVTRDNSRGIPLARGKYLTHYYRPNRTDPARGGLIRPLAWMSVMHSLPLKDALSFTERYGMPFVVAKVDGTTGESERRKLIRLIRNFGPNGGGVISRSAELELVSSGDSTGMVYFRLLSYLAAGIAKLLLGQTASSGDSSGLSKGDAQSQVRQDIMQADGRRLDATLNSQLSRLWTTFNRGADVPAPEIRHETESPEDDAADAAVLATLYSAGFEADPEEVSKRFGYTLRRREPSQPAAYPGFAFASAPRAAAAPPPKPKPAAPGAKRWVGPVERLIEQAVDAAEKDDDSFDRLLRRLGDADMLDEFDTEAAGEMVEERMLTGLVDGAVREGRRVAARREERK